MMNTALNTFCKGTSYIQKGNIQTPFFRAGYKDPFIRQFGGLLGTLLFHGLFGDEKAVRPFGGYFETLIILYKENISIEIIDISLLLKQICGQIGNEIAGTRPYNITLILPELHNFPITLSSLEFLQIVYTTLTYYTHQSQFSLVRQSFIELSMLYKTGDKISKLLENVVTDKEKQVIYLKNKGICKLIIWPSAFIFNRS